MATLGRRLVLLTVTALLTVAALTGVDARAEQPGEPSIRATAAVDVVGDVDVPRTWTLDELRTLAHHTETVTFQTHTGPETHTYAGGLLDAVLAASRPRGDSSQTNPLLAVAILVTGADGYTAALSWGESSPTVSPRPAMLALVEDGNVLDRPRLVLPTDLAGGRQVRDVVTLRVVTLAAPVA
ncbi:molybdopterin-binding oxidoreductase [Mycolicibacterium parafortuitum]|uniref:molybdopterin-binding oxidoreductase n=1 Tax=Mycolicibacterium parafortuitum TaxID=39692 RepID=UPI0032C48D6E